jgi:hypothetical protein
MLNEKNKNKDRSAIEFLKKNEDYVIKRER